MKTKSRSLPGRSGTLRCGPLGLLAAVTLFAACRAERSPAVPVIGGARSGQPGETLSFWALGTDPGGGNVSYLFDWGDGTGDHWTAGSPSDDTVFRRHVFGAAGSFPVRARARADGGLESDWTASLRAEIGFAGPSTPVPACETSEVEVGDPLLAWAAAGHVRGESVSIRFHWGDTVGDWSRFVAVGEPVQDSHRYRLPGAYALRARARDRSFNESPWSPAESVLVVDRPLVAPTDLHLAASSGVNVRLSWQPGSSGDSVLFGVWFRPNQDAEFELLETTGLPTAVHYPEGVTGDYTVSVLRGSTHVFSADTASTVPVRTPGLELHELNAEGPAGLGWDSATGLARLFAMTDSASAAAVDCYLTDRGPQHAGPDYFVASPHLGPADPGGGVPDGPWRRTGLLNLWGSPSGPLPPYDSLVYGDMADATASGSYIAIYTADGYYGLILSEGGDPERGTTEVTAWLQRVRGLRLVE